MGVFKLDAWISLTPIKMAMLCQISYFHTVTFVTTYLPLVEIERNIALDFFKALFMIYLFGSITVLFKNMKRFLMIRIFSALVRLLQTTQAGLSARRNRCQGVCHHGRHERWSGFNPLLFTNRWTVLKKNYQEFILRTKQNYCLNFHHNHKTTTIAFFISSPEITSSLESTISLDSQPSSTLKVRLFLHSLHHQFQFCWITILLRFFSFTIL